MPNQKEPIRCSLLETTMDKNVDKYDAKVNKINNALYTLIEAQKNTTKNVDNLTADIKSISKTLSHLESIDRRLNDLENSKTWGFRLVITGAIGFVVWILKGLVGL